MRQTRHIIRGIFLVGLVMLPVCALAAATVSASDWFDDAIYQGCAVIAVTSAVLWALAELLMRHVPPSRGFYWVVGSSSFGAVFAPGVYLVAAAFIGRSEAERTTWHLLPVFAVLWQVLGFVVGLLFGVMLAITDLASERITRRRRSKGVGRHEGSSE